jgi:hypothetical protein
MAYIYVKSGGTATGTAGKYSSPKTGSWSTAFATTAEYYGDLVTACTASSYSPGDIFYVSNLHNYSTSSSTTRNFIFDFVKVICVNDTNLSSLSTGALENPGVYASNGYSFTGSYVYGISFRLYSSQSFTGGTDANPAILENCTLQIHGSNSVFYYTCELGYANSNNHDVIYFKNCTIDFGVGTNWTYPNSIYFMGGIFYFINCTFLAYANASWEMLESYDIFSIVRFIGCDFTGANRPLCSTQSNAYNQVELIFDRCNFATGNSKLVFPTNGNLFESHGFYLSGSIEPGKFLAQYYKYGYIESLASIYRNGGAESIQGLSTIPYSIRATSSSGLLLTGSYFLRFKLVDLIEDFSVYKSITIKIAQPNSSVLLKNSDIWIDVWYPDSVSTKANRKTTQQIPLTSAYTYPYSTDVTWTGLTGPVLQEISITTDTIGKEGLCSIWVYIQSPSKTIYLCPKVTINKI